MQVSKSNKLANVCYDIRGPVLRHAKRLEEEGHRILKLNIGNPAPFGFEAPEEILQDVIRNLPTAQGYSDSKGLFSARKAIMQYYQQKQVEGVGIEDIYLGNGVSELIVMSMQALLNNGDEVLIPAPDYPLWTAAVSLAGGKPVHYLCDEQANWWPDLADIKAKITPNTKALVLINPNNPTGAVYPKEVLEGMVELARQHKLVLFSDEIYDKILYDDAVHISTASLAPDVLCLTFNGLSKSYRVAGFRSGWVAISGPKHKAQSYIEGLDILANMRLCANVPAQHAIQTALGGYQSINDLMARRRRLPALRQHHSVSGAGSGGTHRKGVPAPDSQRSRSARRNGNPAFERATRSCQPRPSATRSAEKRKQRASRRIGPTALRKRPAASTTRHSLK
ncbi:LL-diaminopimelate aminotransferase [Stutzerimonas stutzeri]